MAHGHSHHHRHGNEDGSSIARPLTLVLVITAGYAFAEVAGGWLANSLALLADAGHMLTDVMALALALFASWSARRPPDPSRTYGYQRAEILAALVNGVALIVIALFIFIEAWERMWEPPEVAWGMMSIVAAGGLVVNLAGAAILRPHREGLNVRAAYLHVLGDLLGSVGALTAAGLIALYGWLWADPLASVMIGGIIVVGAVRLVLDSVSVLMESAPAHLDTETVRQCLLTLDGVGDVHDLHLWSLVGERPLLSAHLVVDHSLPSAQVLRNATSALRQRFSITHVTLQVEPPDFNIVQRLFSDPEGAEAEATDQTSPLGPVGDRRSS